MFLCLSCRQSCCSATWAASRADGWVSPSWSSVHSWRAPSRSSGSPWGCAAPSPTAVPPPSRRRVRTRGALRQPRTRNVIAAGASSWAYPSPAPKGHSGGALRLLLTLPCSKQQATSLDTMMIVMFL
ncbi:hypothetical protein CEXT_87231 [Caerostris extrusa]|uniref:Secreted protein n=1 Tax=Caerostris extrusa TaxID=172846 RepID=A0AAV4T8E2_CAEEX|nr:hypothetical protein CEXT_87231 [Caerostris extrusa]